MKRFLKVQFDGSNGDVLEGEFSLEEAAEFMVSRKSRHSPWEPTEAANCLGDCVLGGEVVVDYAGDRQLRLRRIN